MNPTKLTPKFLGRAAGHTGCACCGRTVKHMYLIDEGAGPTPFGRRCASRIMGWATTRVEMEAKKAERVAEVTRRESIIAAAYPDLAATYSAFQTASRERRTAGYDPYSVPMPADASVFQTAACTDWMWRDESWSEYITDSIVGIAS